ncbi:LA2681 family HEPN domain-containing protein [Parvibaculum sp.]|uniref:LA2681 family HEPN domain-containing protein n=1 Tax=Parvibaculum sp. TaxID=2024848 RepID=UPI001D3138B8|nr:LA2681 family HEPN domain-containing protein [Parvibaculum sp.]MBX3489061.1 hypothetical protein [Parvibaculum sp.]MCW5727070.1 hypothetical protein [Parvibaculum sp.]
MSRYSHDTDIGELIRAPTHTLSDGDAINCVARLIDLSTEVRSEAGIKRAFGMLKEINRRSLTPAQQATLHYFRANAWGAKRVIEAKVEPRQWEQPDRQQQILALFMAKNHDGFASLNEIRRCQILTNLGIQFNEVGRFIEAIELWDRALDILPNFAMAHGSRGDGLKYYGLASEDGYDREVLLLAAHRAFVSATAKGALWDSDYPPAFREHFRTGAREIDERLDLAAIASDLDLDSPRLGRSKAEEAYRRWCLGHRLFLNPLNDLGPHPIAASDYLMLPSLRVGLEEAGMPSIIGFYSQMKQEYAFARLLLYEGQPRDYVHFADRRVRLTNTLNYPSFSMATEKMRAAFRLAYSILDKVGYFINSYWRLGTEPHRVGFRSVWYDHTVEKPKLHNRFKDYENWPLHGLFWLSKDLFDDRFQRATNPDAQQIFNIRNHLEHKYLQVHESWASAAIRDPSTDSIGYSISSDDFASKAVRLLKITRAAMIYLPLAVHMEERARRLGSKSDLVVDMPLMSWEDDWKR